LLSLTGLVAIILLFILYVMFFVVYFGLIFCVYVCCGCYCAVCSQVWVWSYHGVLFVEYEVFLFVRTCVKVLNIKK